ncbi:uncharacterized protein LOC109820498 isoform X2 [Asparagus officinalis]|uniref:uncharacterized protein LOC109820498 isoform X2 n=1 Tax=Asparagus officinalis TaxID=4686 RepID=UPI00098E8246|nr:uncharacterized protein LOC109820498 isoform X2 [Asparagus officinalis]
MGSNSTAEDFNNGDINPLPLEFDAGFLDYVSSAPPPMDSDMLTDSHVNGDFFGDALAPGSFESSITGQAVPFNNINNVASYVQSPPASFINAHEARVGLSPGKIQREAQQERQAYQPPMNVNRFNSISPMRTTDSYAAPRDSKSLLEDSGSYDDPTGESNKSNRGNALPNNASKYCTCKALCLKRYCRCFSQNYYCRDCSCVGCFNSSGYEDSVRMAHEDIKLRDFKVGIGCSLNCRCAGCQNFYGKRQGTEPIIQRENGSGRRDSTGGRTVFGSSEMIRQQLISSTMKNGQIVVNDNQLSSIVPETLTPGSGSEQSDLIQGPSDVSDEYLN